MKDLVSRLSELWPPDSVVIIALLGTILYFFCRAHRVHWWKPVLLFLGLVLGLSVFR